MCSGNSGAEKIGNAMTLDSGGSSRTAMKRFGKLSLVVGGDPGTTLAVAGPVATAGMTLNPRAREKFRDKFREFTKGKKSDPPPADSAPAQKQSVTQAQRIARDRQRRRALAAGGRKSTIKTGSLGVQDRAPTSRKTLLGE